MKMSETRRNAKNPMYTHIPVEMSPTTNSPFSDFRFFERTKTHVVANTRTARKTHDANSGTVICLCASIKSDGSVQPTELEL